MASLIQSPYAQQASGSPSQALALTQATGTGDLLVVCIVAGNSGNTVSSITDNATGGSNTYVQAPSARATQGSGTPKIFTDIWYCDQCKAGATPVTVTFASSTGHTSAVGVMEWGSGIISPPFDTAAGNNGNGTPAAGASVTTTAVNVLMACIGIASGTTNSVASPWTSIGSGIHMVCYYNDAPAGTTNPTYTLSGEVRWCSSTASFDTIAGVVGASNILLKKVT